MGRAHEGMEGFSVGCSWSNICIFLYIPVVAKTDQVRCKSPDQVVQWDFGGDGKLPVHAVQQGSQSSMWPWNTASVAGGTEALSSANSCKPQVSGDILSDNFQSLLWK